MSITLASERKVHSLIETYMPLANKLAFDRKKTLPKFIDVEELQSAAYLGLTEAANRFDESRGISFSTFAYPRIVGAIIDALRQQGWGKRNCQKYAVSLETTIDELELKSVFAVSEEKNANDMFEVICLGFEEQAVDVLRSYFIEEKSMKEIGKEHQVSESRISQLISNYKRQIHKNWTFTDLIELAA